MRERDEITMKKLLILEDDIGINNALCAFFQKGGYTVWQAFCCSDADKKLLDDKPDILIIDITLPDGSGLIFGKSIFEKYQLPIIFLTAMDEEQDILQGYEAGCEEYITKPVSPVILQKKIETILRRNTGKKDVFCYKELKVDYDKQRLWKSGEEIKLTAKEWKVFQILSMNRGRIITKETLLDKIWDIEGNYVDDHAINVVINRLRKKIESDTAKPDYIRNIFGVGYTFGE